MKITAQKVKKFSTDIANGVKKINPDIEIDIDFDVCYNSTETAESIQAILSTKFGRICVFPDFKMNSATAFIVNLGMINYMRQEGFTDDAIMDSKIFSDAFPYTDSSIIALSTFLSQKLKWK